MCYISLCNCYWRIYFLNWFNYLLKGASTPNFSTAPVQLFVMGTGSGKKDEQGRLMHGGHWIESDAWPLSNAEEKNFFLHEDGSLTLLSPSQVNSSTTFTFDPTHPVPTLGGNVSARVKDGAFDQRERPDFYGSMPPYLPLKARKDILVFQTEPLPEDVQVIGPIEVRLYVSSSCLDTDFTVKLVDVYPPSEDFPGGFDLNLTDGICRMSYRNGRNGISAP